MQAKYGNCNNLWGYPLTGAIQLKTSKLCLYSSELSPHLCNKHSACCNGVEYGSQSYNFTHV